HRVAQPPIVAAQHDAHPIAEREITVTCASLLRPRHDVLRVCRACEKEGSHNGRPYASCEHSCLSLSSSQISTPRDFAFSRFVPASSPAIGADVFFDTLPATVPPAPSMSAVASVRDSVGSVPVSTNVRPENGPVTA